MLHLLLQRRAHPEFGRKKAPSEKHTSKARRSFDNNARSRYLRNDSIIKNDSASSVKQWFVVTLQHLDIVRNSLGQMWITGRSDTFANQAGYVIWGAWIAAITSS